MAEQKYDVVVVGGGLSGLSVGICAASEGLLTAVVDRNEDGFGGSIRDTALIENFPGFPNGISGHELVVLFKTHAAKHGANLIGPVAVTDVERAGSMFTVQLDDGSQLMARCVVMATGVQFQRLEAPGVSRLVGCGISYSSPPTTGSYRDQEFYVVGAGNSAAIAAKFLAEREGCCVNMLVRGPSLSKTMSRFLINYLTGMPNVKFHFETEVAEALGRTELEQLVLTTPEGRKTVDARHLYVYIGTRPKANWLKSVSQDGKGFILTGSDVVHATPRLPFETSASGIFAVGTGRAGCSPRAPSASGEGSQVIASIFRYLAQ